MPKKIRRDGMKFPYTSVWYLGVDPGANGGVAAITNHSGDIYPSSHTTEWFTDMKSRKDLADFLRSFCLDPNHICKSAVVELNHSSPQMGVVSAMTFGRNCEMPSAMLSALGIPYDEVRPQEWQKYLQIPPRKKGRKPKGGKTAKGGESTTQWKERLRAKAQQMFPAIDLWQQTKKIQYAVCDALLIAEYCRRIHS